MERVLHDEKPFDQRKRNKGSRYSGLGIQYVDETRNMNARNAYGERESNHNQ